jgi:hypothetical protein
MLIFTLEVNINVDFPFHSMKAYRGSKGVASLFLNLGTRWRWVVNFAHQLLSSLGKRTVDIFSRRQVGLQGWSG